MNPRSHAIKVGIRRGWTLTRLGLRNPGDLVFYLLWGGGMAAYLILNRNDQVGDTGLSFATVTLPGAIAAMIVFGGLLGPAFALVVEREDGTMLRAKSAPNGLVGWVTSQVVYQVMGAVPTLVVLIVPTALFIDDLMYRGAYGWAMVALFILLGFLATLPIGMVLGSLARKPGHVSTWGMFPLIGLTLFSGIFGSVTNHAGWVQGLVQVFPTYWMGHLMRWAFLPDSAKSIELGGEWRLLPAIGVLVVWSAVGLALAPVVLRRMARRESGSAVQARMAERMQRIG